MHGQLTMQRSGAAQAALGNRTYTAPAAITYVAPTAITYVAPSAVPADSVESTAPTTAEFNAALAALASVRTQLIADAADLVATRTQLVATAADLAATRTQLIALAADVATHKTLNNELQAVLVDKGIMKGAA